jgi:hypothetical protein
LPFGQKNNGHIVKKTVDLYLTMCQIAHMEVSKLKEWRGSRTLEQAAAVLGIHISYLSLLERGKRKPSADKRLDFEEKTQGFVTYKDWQ